MIGGDDQATLAAQGVQGGQIYPHHACQPKQGEEALEQRADGAAGEA